MKRRRKRGEVTCLIVKKKAEIIIGNISNLVARGFNGGRYLDVVTWEEPWRSTLGGALQGIYDSFLFGF